METHSETPPEGLWEAVERGVDRRAQALSRRRRTMGWWIGSGAAAAVATLLLVVGGQDLLFGPEEVAGPDIAVEHRDVTPTPNGITTPDQTTPQTTPQTQTPPPTMIPTPNRASTRILPHAPDESETALLVQIPEPTPEPSPMPIPEAKAEKTPDKTTVPTPGSQSVRPDYEKLLAAESHKPAKRKRWHTDLYASNMSSIDTPGDMYATSAMEGTVIYNGFDNMLEANSIGSYALRGPTYTDVRHRQPLTLGVSVGYGLSDRWSLVSGLNYTRLSSQLQTFGNINSRSHDQILNYVGIPLNVNYDLWRAGRFSVYLSAGGQMSISVAGRVKYDDAFGGSAGAGRKESISDRLQWSVNGSAGAGYDFSPTVGIYVEPGIDYYLDNGSRVETIFKEKPLNFGLRMGLRFSL
jgi:hypothetical protein